MQPLDLPFPPPNRRFILLHEIKRVLRKTEDTKPHHLSGDGWGFDERRSILFLVFDVDVFGVDDLSFLAGAGIAAGLARARSEERRVGKESRWRWWVLK